MELKYELYIAGTAQAVWDAFILPEMTKQVFFGSVIQSSFKVGDPFEYVGPDQNGDETVHMYGTIQAFEPCQKLTYIEHPGASYYPNHADLQSRVSLTLEPVGNCTKLVLINDEWTDNHPSYANSFDTWALILSNIKTLVETGKPLDLGY